MQLCLKPRGARGIEFETFRRRGQLLSFILAIYILLPSEVTHSPGDRVRAGASLCTCDVCALTYLMRLGVYTIGMCGILEYFTRVYRVGVWFGLVRFALLLAVVLCWVDRCSDAWCCRPYSAFSV